MRHDLLLRTRNLRWLGLRWSTCRRLEPKHVKKWQHRRCPADRAQRDAARPLQVADRLHQELARGDEDVGLSDSELGGNRGQIQDNMLEYSVGHRGGRGQAVDGAAGLRDSGLLRESQLRMAETPVRQSAEQARTKIAARERDGQAGDYRKTKPGSLILSSASTFPQVHRTVACKFDSSRLTMSKSIQHAGAEGAFAVWTTECIDSQRHTLGTIQHPLISRIAATGPFNVRTP
jgi:hypothetical protein